MGSRRDNRSGGAAVAGPQRHAKMDHERRNQELLKRLACGPPPSKAGPQGVSPARSKSPTEAPEPRGKSRGRKKSELEGALRSFQRQTSSSTLRMSGAGTKSARRGDVFERLSKVDSNKSAGRTEQSSAKAPLKSGRRSPQERTVAGERPLHQGVRKAGVGEAAAPRKTPPRRDALSGVRKEEEEDDDDGDVTTEKQEQEKVPETVDKDRDDPPLRRDASSASPTPQGAGRTPSCAPARRATQHADASAGGRTNDDRRASDAIGSSGRRKPDRKADPKTPAVVDPRRKAGRDECGSPGKTGDPQGSSRAGAEARRRRSPKTTRGTEVVSLSSACDVLQKVRERVSDGHLSDRANGPEVVDDDKDVCEADKADDDDDDGREFYKISVQTRLVTYNNSTLVIKNTSKSDAEEEEAAAAADHNSSEGALQTSSAAEAASAADVEAGGGAAAALAPLCPTEAQEEEEEREEEEGAEEPTRTSSVRRKLAHFVSRGRSFLSEVYSATQTKLEQYKRTESPSSTASWDASAGDRTRPESPCSVGSWDASRDSRGEDADSGYYTIPPPLVETNPLWVEDEDRPPVGAAGPAQETESLGGSREIRQEKKEEEISEDAGRLVVDEEWIKKNVLCTCECRDGRAEDAPGGDPKGAQEEDPAAPGSSEALELAEVSSSDGEMCYCSCHDSGHEPLPQEVQELLDADHARMWWTITGNFGNILPIDWSKTYTRQQYLPVLNLNEIKDVTSGTTEEIDGGTEENAEEEEEVAQDLDLHHLILNGLTDEPVKTAEEVIQEIDDIMQEGSSSEDECVDSSSSGENTQEPTSRPFPAPLYADKLKNMSVAELNESLMELELVIRQYSETLINQLALRDELEYEKELKNSFISLLLQVQNKRRNFNVEKKKQKKVGPNGTDPKYLTTVIPYDVGHGPPHNPTLQILIKILMAINEDSPTVPTLLTDYILKVDC